MRTADGYMIRKCLEGDSAAFGFLVDKYRGAVYALAYSRLRNFHDAEDVAQEVFIKAYEKLSTLKQYDRFHAWLYTITYNMCKHWARAESRRPDGELMEGQSSKMLAEASVESYRQESLHESIREALDSMPGIYSQVLTLHYLGGLSTGEIAEFAGVSPAAIRQRLTRARTQLRSQMLPTMETAFEAQRLPVSFTFHIAEAVKHIKIKPIPRAAGLTWGMSLATGIALIVLSLNPNLKPPDPNARYNGSSPPSAMRGAKTGEIFVDVLAVSEMAIQGSGDGVAVKPLITQNAFLMANRGNTWAKTADMPTIRGNLDAVAMDGYIYVIGGCSVASDPADTVWKLATVEKYDPARDTWTRKADMPTARRGLSTCVANGKIYAIGGWTPDWGSLTSAVEEYNPATDTWTKKSDMPSGSKAKAGVCLVNGKLYVIGGWGHGIPFSTVEEYDPATDTWVRRADMPTARGYLSATVVNGKIYAVGGNKGTYVDKVYTPAVEEYDPATDTWTRKADMPGARMFHAACALNRRIYVIGGKGPIKLVEEYDPATDTWTSKADMLVGRSGLGAVLMNGKIYAVGGDTSATVEEYTPEGWRPSLAPPQGESLTTWGGTKLTGQTYPPHAKQ